MPQSKFTGEQAVEIARACAAHQVEYLFIGKSGAILRDIIASKRASNREKDLADLLLLEEFRSEYEKRHAAPAETAAQKALRKAAPTRTRSRK